MRKRTNRERKFKRHITNGEVLVLLGVLGVVGQSSLGQLPNLDGTILRGRGNDIVSYEQQAGKKTIVRAELHIEHGGRVSRNLGIVQTNLANLNTSTVFLEKTAPKIVEEP